MGSRLLRTALALFLVGGIALVGWKLKERLDQDDAGGGGPGGGGRATRRERPPAPVEVGTVRVGTIVDRRTFSGTLEAPASFVVAPKVGGRVKQLAVDVGDPVRRGMTVAWLDDDEFVQAEAQANADVAVAKANHAAAESALQIADRELERIEELNQRGVTSDTQLDVARADQLSKAAAVKVAAAQVKRAEAAAAAASIRLGYTKVVATWLEGDDERVVGERFVAEGATVGANSPLFRIVELDPILAVINVVERDYGRIEKGQRATLATDALPGVPIEGEVVRVSPIFRNTTRQARVELSAKNPDQRLKPGMFVRVTAALETIADATIVSRAALTKRADRVGVFTLDESGDVPVVRWRPVVVGVREGDEVQVSPAPDPAAKPDDPPPAPIAGRVVTLGQELVSDGAKVSIPADASGADDEPAESGG